MVKYFDKRTGSNGTMRIKDTGTWVEFWLKASSYTYNYTLPWGYRVNGDVDGTNSFRFEGSGDWQRLGRWNVTTDQTVTFYLYDSGTSGLGGPTTLSAFIERSGPPLKPNTPTVDEITGTTARVSFANTGSNGSPIDERQISFGTTSTASGGTRVYNGPHTLTGLLNRQKYYVKARSHNAHGWGPWSDIRSFVTLGVPAAPSKPMYVINDLGKFTVTFSPPSDTGGSPITGRQFGLANTPSAPTGIYDTSGYALTFSGLVPGETYYMWGRVANSVGWGPWSVRASVTLPAALSYKNGTTWVDGAVYVRHNGVWRLAKPYVKIAGMWLPTS